MIRRSSPDIFFQQLDQLSFPAQYSPSLPGSRAVQDRSRFPGVLITKYPKLPGIISSQPVRAEKPSMALIER